MNREWGKAHNPIPFKREKIRCMNYDECKREFLQSHRFHRMCDRCKAEPVYSAKGKPGPREGT